MVQELSLKVNIIVYLVNIILKRITYLVCFISYLSMVYAHSKKDHLLVNKLSFTCSDRNIKIN